MPTPAMNIPSEDFQALEEGIEATIASGTAIRTIGKPLDQTYNAQWEVEAAVESLHVFASR